MKRAFMIGVAAGALLAGANIAVAQGTMERQQPGAAGGGGATEQKSGSGAQQQQKGQDAQKQGDQPKQDAQKQGDQKKQDAQKQGDQQKQDAQKQGDQKKQDAQKQGDQKGDQQKGAQKPDQKQDAQSKDKDGQKSADSKSGGGSKTLSTEQKTKIRTTVISSGPKVTNVNFSVSVGTVIPRTVTVAPLHPVLVEIYPEWRSYRFVIVEERIIIVEPDSFKIVAVLVV